MCTRDAAVSESESVSCGAGVRLARLACVCVRIKKYSCVLQKNEMVGD